MHLFPALVVGCLMALFSATQTANILALFPMPGKSHFVMFETLLKALAEKGHQVDVVSHFSPKNPPKGYTEISLRGTLPIPLNNVTASEWAGQPEMEMVHIMARIMGVNQCELLLKTEPLQNLKKSTKHYDLVITEIFGSDCMLGFGPLFKAPVISIISSVNLPWASDRFGLPDNPSYIPTYFSHFSPRMNLWEKMWNTLSLVRSKTLYHWYSHGDTERIMRDFFGPSVPRLHDLTRNTSLVLVNSYFSMNGVRPVVPGFVEVGGLHVQKPNSLNPHFEKILTTGVQNGVIYLTMGSMILTETFPIERLQGMFDAFSELPYKVLWKATKEKFPKSLKIPENVHFESWMPQMDILCHPNVKLFVSHGGLMGAQEAVYCGVPRLGIPLFADQITNIKSSEKMGLAVEVPYEEISKETMLNAAKKLLYDKRYKERAEEAANIFKDRPMSPLETAIYWVEYVIRHKGAPHLRSAAVDLAWFEYYLLDVMAVVFLGMFGVVYATKIAWGAVFKAKKLKKN